MAGKIFDRQLRLRALKLTNAYEQPGIVQRPLSNSDRLIDIINIYQHEHWPREKVYCSQCNGHHHRRGFTALVSSNSTALIRMLLGSKCGADAFGEDWQTAKRRMEEQHKRQWELARLDRLDTVRSELRAALQIWRERVPAVVGRKSAFVLRLGELSSRLIEAHNHHNGHLFVHRTMTLRDGSQHLDTQILDRLPGAELFNSLNMIDAIERTQTALEVMARSIPMSDRVPTALLRKRRRVFEDSLQDLPAVSKIYAAAQSFFTAQTFARIADWTKRHAITRKQFGWNGKGIKSGPSEFALPSPFPDLSEEPLDLIAEYRRAD